MHETNFRRPLAIHLLALILVSAGGCGPGLQHEVAGDGPLRLEQNDLPAFLRGPHNQAFFFRHNEPYRVQAAIHFAHGRAHDVPQQTSLANAADCVVASVDYRLAPEHRYPTAAEDAFSATRWVATEGRRLGIDGRRLAVGGDSAGGNVAAVVTLMARERGGPPLAFQLLVVPCTHHAFDTPSYKDCG